MGENELSKKALRLENAGSGRDLETMRNETHSFINELQSLVTNLKSVQKDSDAEITEADEAFLREKLLEIKTACSAFDNIAVKAGLNELKNKTWPDHINDVLDNISINILHSAFRKTSALVDDFLNSIP